MGAPCLDPMGVSRPAFALGVIGPCYILGLEPKPVPSLLAWMEDVAHLAKQAERADRPVHRETPRGNRLT